jgi:FKBP12-rapamycin complex-associated protein
MLNEFVAGLKSRSDDVREKTAHQLQQYVDTELREMNSDQYAGFMNDLNHHIFEMVSGSEMHEKKGGVMAIMSLVGVDGGSSSKVNRFANYLRHVLPCGDTVAMEMAAKTVGQLALSGGTFTAEYVEFEVKRSIEALQADRNEGRRHAAVLILRELAVNAPTLFYQKVQPFFDNIFTAIRDPKHAIREGAIAALRACLVLTSQRESKDNRSSYPKRTWYQQAYEEAEKGLTDQKEKGSILSRDDRAHGSLLIINELILNSNLDSEFLEWDVDDIELQQQKPYLKALEELSNPNSKFIYHRQTTARQSGLERGYSQLCRDFMLSKFDDVCHHVLKLRMSRNINQLVQQGLLALLPRLAAFHSDRFVKGCLSDCMSYFLSCLKKERDKPNAFRAIGLTAIAIRADILQHLHPVLSVIQMTLPAIKDATLRKSKTGPPDLSVFNCISMLARALGDSLTNEMKSLLDLMLAVGLSPALTSALKTLAADIPSLKRDIQGGLLQILSTILLNKPSTKHVPATRTTSTSSIQSGSSPFDTSDPANLTLAMQTLSSFEFDSHTLTQFVRQCADNFLSSEVKEVRMEAVKTCCRLLTPALKLQVSPSGQVMPTTPVSQTQVKVVSEVLSKLLFVGITDHEEDIRLCVLSNLDGRFDGHLAQAENLNALFVALNDELFSVRELAICTIGRLSALNPAYVMPSLRKTLIQILTELEFSGVGRNKEQAAKLLSHLIANAPRLIKPYMEPIFKVLVPKLKEPDSNPGIVTSVLAAVGELAGVSGRNMRSFADELFPVLIEILRDSLSLQKREVLLHYRISVLRQDFFPAENMATPTIII